MSWHNINGVPFRYQPQRQPSFGRNGRRLVPLPPQLQSQRQHGELIRRDANPGSSGGIVGLEDVLAWREVDGASASNGAVSGLGSIDGASVSNDATQSVADVPLAKKGRKKLSTGTTSAASSSKRRKPQAEKDDPRKKEKYTGRKTDRQKVASGKRAKEEAEKAAEESRKKLAKEQDERDLAVIDEAMRAEEATEGEKAKKAAPPAKKGRKKKDPNAPKGPRKATVYYQIEVRSQFNADNPGMKGQEVNKLIAQSWKKLTSDEQQPYMDLAKEDRVRHKREVAEYEARKAAEEMATGTRSRNENALVALATVERQWETVDAAEAALALRKAAGGSSNESEGCTRQTLYNRISDAKKVLLERQKDALEWLVGDVECEIIRDGIDGLATYSNERNHLEDPKTVDQHDWESDAAFAFREEYHKLNGGKPLGRFGKLTWKKRWLGEQRRHLKEKIAEPLASRPAVLDAAKIAFREEFDFDQSIHAVLSAQQDLRTRRTSSVSGVKRGQIVGLGYRLTVSDGDVRDGGGRDKRDRVCGELNSILGSNMTFDQRLSSAEELVGAMTVMKF